MKKIKIITDSNSGILQKEAEELGIIVIPMPFTINGDEYLEELTISQNQFYEFLEQNADVTTSQPSQFYMEEVFSNALKDNDEVVYIPMTSGLSGTCANAIKIAEKFDGRVEVVDNLRISVTLKQSVLNAITLAKNSKAAKEIKQLLEEQKNLSSIYITMGTLKYLKKGGRITATAAALGNMLHIKPILFSNGGNFEKCAMSLNLGQAKKKMIAQIKQDLETKFKDQYQIGNMALGVAHTQNPLEAEKFKDEILNEIPNLTFTYTTPLSLSVSCHIGPGALACAIFPKEQIV